VSETVNVCQPYFEDVQLGETVARSEYGPLDIQETVRWAGVQENLEQIHWDREFCREHSGLRTFIASGSYRQALLVRMVTDWVGPDGTLVGLSVRHTYPTYEGDLMKFGATVVERSSEEANPTVTCELEGQNQEGRGILSGRCTVRLPRRAGRTDVLEPR
jgi:acyl dehydratase